MILIVAAAPAGAGPGCFFDSLSHTETMSKPIITSSPDVMGGTPVFAGTRVPLQTLLDYIEAGESIDDFLGGFPTVSREQVVAFLEEAKQRMSSAVI